MTTALAPLTKTATVTCSQERAFELFTREMSEWWPLTSHSVGQSAGGRVDVEEWTGGHLVETLPDGTTTVWGAITIWEPPTRIEFSWHPGRAPEEATHVMVGFVAAESGRETVVTLVHTDWRTPVARHNYDTGWDFVPGRLAAAATVSHSTG